MKLNKKGKRIIIAVTAVVLVAAIGVGVWLKTRGGSEPVNVYSFEYLGMTDYWGDSQNGYGPVSTDKIQTVYLSDTQTVTEVMVSEGDTVKKGDVLLTFDTTLSDIQLERKRLEVEKLKLQLEEAKRELQRIRGMKPMVLPSVDPDEDDGDEDVNLGVSLTGPYRLSNQSTYDGSSKNKALVCWLNSATFINDELLETIRQQAEQMQNENAQLPPEETDPDENDGEEAQAEGGEDDTEPADPEPVTVNAYYVIFKVTEGNMSLGGRITWQGVYVSGKSGSFGLKFFDASGIADHTMAQVEDYEEPSTPNFDFGSGYTAAQIAQMRVEQEKKIKDLEFNIKMAEANYKIMQTEVNDGKVYAEVDGQVVSLLDPEEAKQAQQPMLKVSGGGGFYIKGSVSELEKDNLTIGQEVSVNDWNSGMTYTGTVESIGDFPTNEGYWNGSGNPNVTYYPFTIFVDGSADLQAGRYVDYEYSTAGDTKGIYLEKAFIRTEKGRSYVLVIGENDKLEKRYVTEGKSLWGSYMEIRGDVTPDDYLAFPYGKNVKEGAPAVKSDIQELYNGF